MWSQALLKKINGGTAAPASDPVDRGGSGDELTAAIKKNWRDKTLLQADDLYGEKWPRGNTLYALVSHEIHHVGQMTVLLRQSKAKVPGLFGPSKEEWKKMGMKPPAY